MKKRKLLFLFPLAALVLSGCSFEEAFETAKSFMNDKIVEPVKDLIPGAKKEEKQEKEEKDEKPSESEGQEGEGQEGQGGEGGEGGGQETPPEEQKQLVSISVSGQFKQEYEVGEEFDSAGIIVTAVYSDESTEDVSSQAQFSGFSSEEAGSCSVTVSFEGQTASIELTINPAVKRDWTDEEKAIFAEHLHGVVIPFLPLEGATPSYNAATDSINILNAEGEYLQVSESDIPDFAALFVESDGWEDVSNQYTAFSKAPAGSFWVFERSVSAPEGMRRISVQFFGKSGSDYSLSGNFYFFASDPFIYEFPSEAIAQAFAALGLPAFTIPAPEGEGLFFEFNPDPNNAYYLEMGMTDYVYDDIYIYGLSSEGFENYLDIIEEAGWKLTAGNGSYMAQKEFADGVASFITADVGDYAVVEFYYVMDPLPTTEWPTEGAAALVEAAVSGSNTVIPAFESEDITNFEVDDYNNEIDVYGPESLKDEYAAILKAAGWADGSAADYYVSPDGDIQVRLLYSSTYGLRIMISAVPAWPAAAVAALIESLVPGSETVVPPMEGATRYNWWTSTELDVYAASPSEFASSYGESLVAAGWTDDGNGVYISPAEDIQIELAPKSSWIEVYFSAYVKPAPVWPADEVAALLPAGTTDSLPAFVGANNGFTVVNDQYGTAVLVKVDADSEADAIAAYQAILLDAGYSELIPDSRGDMQYLSPNNQLMVSAYVGTSGSITITFGKAPFTVWPSEAIAEKLAPSEDTLLAIEGAAYFEIKQSSVSTIYIFAYYESSTAASEGLDNYIAKLNTSDFEFLGNDSDGDPHYSSPSGDYEICPYLSGTRVIIMIGLPDATEWPSAFISEMLASFGFTDPIPALSGGVLYNTYTGYGYPQIYVTFATEDDAFDAQETYIGLLEAAGFEYAGDYYGDPKYSSPSGQFEISPWVSDETLIIDIAEVLE